MVRNKIPGDLKSPVASPIQADRVQSDTNSQVDHDQTLNSGTTYDLPSGTNVEVDHGIDASIPYHHPTSAVDGASYEDEDFAPHKAAARVRRQNHVDEETLSRAKMWDPVKDCSDPNTTQADLSGVLPRGHGNEKPMDSTIRNATSMDFHFYHGDHRYVQAQGDRQQSTNPGIRGVASMDLPLDPQSHTMVSEYQRRASVDSQIFQVSPSYDQFQRRPQQQSGYENISALNQHFREPFGQYGQQSLESITRGAALMGIQPRQSTYFNRHSQENGQLMDVESRMPASMASNEVARPQRSAPCGRSQVHTASLATSSNLSTQRSSDQLAHGTGHDHQQADGLQPQNPLVTTTMSQALCMARYGESLDQQSNYTEAVRVYERACTLFQEVIIRSCSLEERMECDTARNTYQARLDELWRQSSATRRNKTQEQDDQQEEDDLGRSKPQYSLFEDFALCHKDEEDLSWQEVAETPIFKDKRKHRSLSQRKHTIGKMGGPQYHEAERPWTVQEDKRLCALGDAGKSLGDIHRKFPSRNAERCLNRYFRLKGYHTISGSHTPTSYQARQDPAPSQRTHSPSAVARHRGYRLHSGSSHYQSVYEAPPTSGQHIPSGLTLGTSPQSPTYSTTRANPFPELTDLPCQLPLATQTPGMPSSSSAFAPRTQGSSRPSMQQGPAAPSSSSSPPDAKGPDRSQPSMSLNSPSLPEAGGNESTDGQSASRRQRPTTSSSASSGSTEDSAISSSSARSATTSPRPKVHDSSDSQSAAANRVRKPRRPTRPN